MARTRGGWFLGTFLLIGQLHPGCDCGTELQKGKPLIVVTPDSLDFGALNIDQVGRMTLQVENVGDAPLSVEALEVTGDPVFGLESWNGAPFDDVVFPAGIAAPKVGNRSFVEVVVRCAPDANAAFTGNLTILSNATNDPEVHVSLRASGSVPDIEASPTQLTFGPVGLGSSKSLGLTLRNVGEAELQIAQDGLSLASADPESPFRWLPLAGPITLAADEDTQIEIVYAPQTVRTDPQTHQPLPDEDVLRIASNDPDENPLEIPLLGQADANLPPVVGVRIIQVNKLDGSPVADVCAPAPSDTLTFEGLVLDPEGETIQASYLFWELAGKPAGSFRELITSPDAFHPTFKPDLTGDYTVCLAASDPEGQRSTYESAAACTCVEANADTDYACPCLVFSAFPREDIRIELTWDFLGPDLDLHLVAPGGDFCSPTQECRYNKNNPQDPTWDRTACVDTGSVTVCRTPNCDPLVAGCLVGQECYDDDDVGPIPPGCWWNTCSGTDCFWDARNPDWGGLGDTTDDPLSAIDCTRGCRAENINLNGPIPGIYTVMVNQFDGTQQPNATVRIYFKGDVVPSYEWTSRMLGACDTWNVALIEWVDHENHPVIYLDDAHSLRCCT